MPDILVLDADGVTNPFRCSDFSRFGLTSTAATAFFEGPFCEQCLIGTADTKQVLAEIAAQHGLSLDIDAIVAHWHEDQKETHSLVTDAVGRLRRSGVHTVLATNQDPYCLAYMQTVMGYGALFDQIFCSSLIGCKKPDLRFFETIQRQLPTGPVHFIDDNQVNVDAARAACGWESHCFAGDEAVAAQLRAWWPAILAER